MPNTSYQIQMWYTASKGTVNIFSFVGKDAISSILCKYIKKINIQNSSQNPKYDNNLVKISAMQIY